jgi:hypothetical protein
VLLTLLILTSEHLQIVARDASEATTRRTREPFSTVPFSRDPDFVDRPDIQAWIHEKCVRPAARAALVGLGGVGYVKRSPFFGASILTRYKKVAAGHPIFLPSPRDVAADLGILGAWKH